MKNRPPIWNSIEEINAAIASTKYGIKIKMNKEIESIKDFIAHDVDLTDEIISICARHIFEPKSLHREIERVFENAHMQMIHRQIADKQNDYVE